MLTTGNWPRALLRIKRAQARRALALPPRSISHLLSPTATGDARLIDRTLQFPWANLSDAHHLQMTSLPEAPMS